MQIWRRNLVAGDANRDWFCAWSRLKLPQESSFSLRSPGGLAVVPLTPFRLKPSEWYDRPYVCCFRLPPAVAAGTYQLWIDGVQWGTVNVWPAGHANAPPVGVGLTFESLPIEVKKPDTLYLRCTFNRSPVFASCGMFVDCEWRGLATPGIGTTHAFSSWGTSGPLAIIGGLFDGCDRGPVFNLRERPAVEPLLADITIRGVSWIDNGNELLCVEGGGDRRDGPALERAILMRWRVSQSEGDFTFFHTPIRDCLLSNITVDRGSVVFFGEAPQVGNTLEMIELRNGRIILGNGATGNRITRCALLNQGPTRGNKFYTDPSFYMPGGRWNPSGIAANGTDARGNAVADCSFGSGG